ncbi:MAG: hypothetical protein ACLR23_13730 [Clostridia bacterium]
MEAAIEIPNIKRSRNLLQISVLRSLGWHVHRLWILDWWENEGEQLNPDRTAHPRDFARRGGKRGLSMRLNPSRREKSRRNLRPSIRRETALPSGLEEYRIERIAGGWLS